MKKLMLTSILAALVALGTTGMAQDYPDEYLGLPGDNLNLYAVMKLFQESETLEGFERNLNAEDSKINNLDLNGDNYIDYITVSDYPDGNDHTIVLRVALDRKESQDVAVFTVQKFHNGTVQIQLIGDEALYGKNYIIEPNYEETPNPGYMGRPESRTNVTVISTTPYEIAYWPLIRYIYMPSYVGWHSSWYWGYYPEWWSPWRPYYWHYYYGYHYNWYNDYYAHYRHWDYCRWNRYNDFYYHGVRAYSPVIQVNITRNVYRETYSRPEQRKEGEALYSRMHPERDSRSVASRTTSGDGRQASGVRTTERPEAKSSQSTVRSTEGTRQPATRSSAEQRPSASTRPSAATRSDVSTRPSASTRPATGDGRQATGNRPEASKSSTEQRPAASTRPSTSSSSSRSGYSQAPAQRSSATSASRPSAPSQKSTTVSSSRPTSQTQRSSTVSSSRSSAPSQRSSATSASRSSGQSQRSSATRSSQPSRSSSSSSSKSSSSKSSSNDSKSGRR
jgi:hypothetical protein